MGFIPCCYAANPIPPWTVAIFDTPPLCGEKDHFYGKFFFNF
jgi:hypothetical protein